MQQMANGALQEPHRYTLTLCDVLWPSHHSVAAGHQLSLKFEQKDRQHKHARAVHSREPRGRTLPFKSTNLNLKSHLSFYRTIVILR